MAELGIVEYFGMAEALGIIATLFVVLYFSRKQMQSLSKQKLSVIWMKKSIALLKIAVERPELIRIVRMLIQTLTQEIAYIHIIFCIPLHMHFICIKEK